MSDIMMTSIAQGQAFRAQGAERAVDMLTSALKRRDMKIEELEEQLAVAQADARARKAQVDALVGSHPSSLLLEATNQRFSSVGDMMGKAKTKLRLIYESTFDQSAAKMGIRNPVANRLN